MHSVQLLMLPIVITYGFSYGVGNPICSNLPAYAHQNSYPEVSLSSFDYYGVRFVSQYRAEETGYYQTRFELVYEVNVSRFVAYSPVTNTIHQDCSMHEATVTGCCPDLGDNANYVFSSECDAVVYTKHPANQRRFLVWEHRKGRPEMKDTVIDIYVKLHNQERRFVYADPNLPGLSSCNQIAKTGHESDSLSLAKALSTAETKQLDAVMLENKCPIKEFSRNKLSLVIWSVSNAFDTNVYVYSRSKSGAQLTAKRQQKLSITRARTLSPWFHETVQLYPRYVEYFWSHNFEIFADRNAEALLVLSGLNVQQLQPKIDSILHQWIIYKQLNTTLELSPKHSMAVRLVRLVVTHTAVLRVGMTKVIPLYEFEKESTRVRFCAMRQKFYEPYLVNKRAISEAGTTYFSIKSVQVTDSGMYQCEQGGLLENHKPFVYDYFIIVLPRSSDLRIYATTKPLTRHDELKDTYAYIGANRIMYMHETESVILNCVYYLSRGLDNYNGLQFHYLIGENKATGSYKFVHRHVRLTRDSIVIVQSYQIGYEGQWTDNQTATFICGHMYEQNFSRVLDSEELPARDRWTMVTITGLRRERLPPKIFTSSITSSANELYHAFRTSPTDHNDFLKSNKLSKKVLVEFGIISGEFLAAYDAPDCVPSVWLITSLDGVSSRLSLCQTKLTRIDKHINSSFTSQLSEEEMKNPIFLLNLVQFRCGLIMESETIILQIFCRKQLLVDLIKANSDFTVQIKEKMWSKIQGTQLRANDEFDSTKFTAVFYAVRVKPYWRGIVNIGQPVSIPCSCTVTSNRTVTWKHRIKDVNATTSLPGGFRTVRHENLVYLFKPSAQYSDSGGYVCLCEGETEEEALKIERKLFVIHEPLKARYEVRHERITHYPSQIVMRLGELCTVTCEMSMPKGSAKKVENILTYKTEIRTIGINSSLIQVEDLQVDTNDTWTTYRRRYLISPDIVDDGETANAQCVFEAYLDEDPRDVTSVPMKFTADILIDQGPKPRIFDRLLFCSSKHLMENYPGDKWPLSAVEFHKSGSNIQDMEHPMDLLVTHLAGPTEHFERVWLFSPGKNIEVCALGKIERFRDENIWKPSSSREKMFYLYRSVFLCKIYGSVKALAILAVNMGNSQQSVDQVEQKLQQYLQNRIDEFYEHPNKDTKTEFVYDPGVWGTIRVQRVHMGWMSAVQRGQTWISLVRHRLQYGGKLSLFYRSHLDSDYKVIRDVCSYRPRDHYCAAEISKTGYYEWGYIRNKTITLSITRYVKVFPKLQDILTFHVEESSADTGLRLGPNLLNIHPIAAINYSRYIHFCCVVTGPDDMPEMENLELDLLHEGRTNITTEFIGSEAHPPGKRFVFKADIPPYGYLRMPLQARIRLTFARSALPPNTYHAYEKHRILEHNVLLNFVTPPSQPVLFPYLTDCNRMSVFDNVEGQEYGVFDMERFGQSGYNGVLEEIWVNCSFHFYADPPHYHRRVFTITRSGQVDLCHMDGDYLRPNNITGTYFRRFYFTCALKHDLGALVFLVMQCPQNPCSKADDPQRVLDFYKDAVKQFYEGSRITLRFTQYPITMIATYAHRLSIGYRSWIYEGNHWFMVLPESRSCSGTIYCNAVKFSGQHHRVYSLTCENETLSIKPHYTDTGIHECNYSGNSVTKRVLTVLPRLDAENIRVSNRKFSTNDEVESDSYDSQNNIHWVRTLEKPIYIYCLLPENAFYFARHPDIMIEVYNSDSKDDKLQKVPFNELPTEVGQNKYRRIVKVDTSVHKRYKNFLGVTCKVQYDVTKLAPNDIKGEYDRLEVKTRIILSKDGATLNFNKLQCDWEHIVKTWPTQGKGVFDMKIIQDSLPASKEMERELKCTVSYNAGIWHRDFLVWTISGDNFENECFQSRGRHDNKHRVTQYTSSETEFSCALLATVDFIAMAIINHESYDELQKTKKDLKVFVRDNFDKNFKNPSLTERNQFKPTVNGMVETRFRRLNMGAYTIINREVGYSMLVSPSNERDKYDVYYTETLDREPRYWTTESCPSNSPGYHKRYSGIHYTYTGYYSFKSKSTSLGPYRRLEVLPTKESFEGFSIRVSSGNQKDYALEQGNKNTLVLHFKKSIRHRCPTSVNLEIFDYAVENEDRTRVSHKFVENVTTNSHDFLFEIDIPFHGAYRNPLEVVMTIDFGIIKGPRYEMKNDGVPWSIKHSILIGIKDDTWFPVIFDSYTSCDLKDILKGFKHHGDSMFNPAIFDESGNKQWIPENTYVCTFTFESAPLPRFEDVVAISDNPLETLHVCHGLEPEKFPYSSYYSLIGDWYSQRKDWLYRKTSVCRLQSHMKALIFMSVNYASNPSLGVDQLRLMVSNFYIQQIQKYVAGNRKNEFTRGDWYEGVKVATRIARVRVGWQASVYRGEPLKMYLRTPYEPVYLVCYYSETPEGQQRRVFSRWFSHDGRFYDSERGMQPTDSGYYSWRVGNGDERWSVPRYFLVIPDSKLLRVFISPVLYDDDADLHTVPPLDPDYKLPNEGGIFVYCAYDIVNQLPMFASFRLIIHDHGDQEIPEKEVVADLIRVCKSPYEHRVVYRFESELYRSYRSPFKATCEVRYNDSVFLEEDLRKSKHIDPIVRRVTMYYEDKLQYIPIIFDNHISTTLTELMTNYIPKPDPISAATFYKTGTVKRIPEQTVDFTAIHYSGMGIGFENLWLITGKGYIDRCFQSDRYSFRKDELPPDVAPKIRLRDFGRVYRSNFVCKLQPDQLALVFIVANVELDANRVKTLENDLKIYYSNLISSFERWPTDTEKKQYTDAIHTWTTRRIQRVHIGWKASVPIGAAWEVLVRHRFENHENLQCHWKKFPSHNSQYRFQQTLGRFDTRMIFQAAKIQDTGYYEWWHLENGVLSPLTRPRYFLVIPDQQIVNIIVAQHPLIGGDTSHRGVPILSYNEPLYINFIVKKVNPGYGHFNFHVQDGTVNSAKDVQVWEFPKNESENQTNYLFRLMEPECITSQETLRSALILTYADVKFPKEDLREPKIIQPITAEISIKVEKFIRPIIFTERSTSNSDEFLHLLVNSKSDIKTSYEYSHSGQLQPAYELPVIWTMYICLGYPRGLFIPQLIYVWENRFYFETCDILDSVDLDWANIPEEIRNRSSKAFENGAIIARVKFECVLRVEHIALNLLALAVKENGPTVKQAEEEFKILLTPVLRYWTEHPKDETEIPLNFPSYGLVTYRLLRLDLRWNATTSVGSVVKMLGHWESNTDPEINCFFQVREDSELKKVIPVYNIEWFGNSHAFYLSLPSVRFEHSGFYSCNVTDKNCSSCPQKVGFTTRQLFVIPDESITEMFLNSDVLKYDDLWTGNYSLCHPDGYPLLLSESHTVIHCQYHSAVLNIPHPMITLRVLLTNSTTANETIFGSPHPSMYKGKYLLAPFSFFTPKFIDYSDDLDVQCVFVYNLSQPVEHDMNEPVGMITVIRSRFMRIEPFIPATIYTRYTSADDAIIRKLYKRLKGQILTAVEFHDSSPRNRQYENVTTVSFLASLGYPYGHWEIMLIYRYEDHFFLECCSDLSSSELSLTELPADVVPASKMELYLEESYLRLNGTCLYRPEHMAMVVVVCNGHELFYDQDEVRNHFRTRYLDVIRHWARSPSDSVPLWINMSHGTFCTHRTIRLYVGWNASVQSGQPVFMLGRHDIKSFGTVTCYFREKLSEKFRLVSTEFSLTRERNPVVKLSTEGALYEHSGYYACNLTGRCVNCEPEIVFVPRRLLVLPDIRQIKVFLNMRLPRDQTHAKPHFTQCERDNVPYLRCNQETYVYCSYLHKKTDKNDPEPNMSGVMMDELQRPHEINVKFVRKWETQKKVTYQVTKVYQIRAPSEREFKGHILITCKLQYENLQSPPEDINPINGTYTVSASRLIRVSVRLRPKIFVDFTNTSRSSLTELLRSQKANSVTSSHHFYSAAMKKYLEGIVKFEFIISLGTPRGMASLVMFYIHKNIIRWFVCEPNSVHDFTADNIFPELQNSDEWLDANGKNFVCFRVICPFMPIHFALAVVAANSFDRFEDPKNVQNNWLLQFISYLKAWRTRPNDQTEVDLDLFPYGFAEFQILQLRIGWRATVKVGEPIILFATLGPEAAGEQHCFYKNDSKKINEVISIREISPDEDNFFISVKRASWTYELIKSHANPGDSGYYWCQVDDCPVCTLQDYGKPRRLIILSDILEIYPLVTEEMPSVQRTVSKRGEKFTHFDIKPIKFVYGAVNYFAHCELRIRTGITVKPSIDLYYLHGNLESNYQKTLPARKVNEISFVQQAYTSVLVSYEVVTPRFESVTDFVQVVCVASFNELIPPEDINTKYNDSILENKIRLKLKETRVPSIRWKTIQVDRQELNDLVRLDTRDVINFATFNQLVTTKRIREGPLNIKLEVDYGVPSGWLSVWLICPHDKRLIRDDCRLMATDKIINDWSGSDSVIKATGRTVDFVQTSDETEELLDNKDLQENQTEWRKVEVECLLQPEDLALIISVQNVIKPKAKLEIEQDFTKKVLKTVTNWLISDKATLNEVVRLPEVFQGEMRMFKLNVGWPATVQVGHQIIMFGRLNSNGNETPHCLWGPQMPTHLLKPKDGFKVQVSPGRSYFTLSKKDAEFGDSGVYMCTLKNCTNCQTNSGMRERRLLVLPDPTIIRLEFIYESTLKQFFMDCGQPQNLLVAPGDSIRMRCSYPVAKGSQRKVKSTIRQEDSSREGPGVAIPKVEIERRERDRVIDVNKLFTIHTPISKTVELQVRCILHFGQITVLKDMVDEIPSVMLSQTKTLIKFRPESPQIYRQSIQTNRPLLTRQLIISQTYTNGYEYMKSAPYARMEEGGLQLNFDAHLGKPRGWVVVWLVYNRSGELLKDACQQVSITSSTTKLVHVRASCPIQPEHVALFFAAVTNTGNSQPEHAINKRIEQMVISNITSWMSDPKFQGLRTKMDGCYTLDYRLVRLKVGWRASVLEKTPIRMEGRLGGRNLGDVRCFYRTSRTSERGQLSDQFSYEIDDQFDKFIITAKQAELENMGWYECSVDNYTGDSVSVGMQARQLIIKPSNDSIQCKVTAIRDTGQVPLEDQLTENKMRYLLANQHAFVQCIRNNNLKNYFQTNDQFHYRMLNESNGQWIEDFPSKKVHVVPQAGTGGTEITSTYRIVAIESKFCTGIMDVSCVTQFRGVYSLLDIEPPEDHFEIRCNQSFIILEGANGQLRFKAITKTVETKPIPAGSKVECTGGFGLPPLTYSWIRIRPNSYANEDLGDEIRSEDTDSQVEEDIPSLLPEDGPDGGWGGPKIRFLDTPTQALHSDGAFLFIPSDPSYRGMNYIYQCIGQNMVENVKYTIKKSLHISVLICPTRHSLLDLSIFVSSNILSACELSQNPDPEIQFYGYYYLSLIRQLILGLPYEPLKTRLSLITNRLTREVREKIRIIPFDQSYDRIDLVRLLYSRDNKPISDKKACIMQQTNLDDLFNLVHEAHSKPFNRSQGTLIPLDQMSKTDLTTYGLDALEKMHQKSIQILLALVYPSNNQSLSNMTFLMSRVQSTRAIHITPEFQGVTDCNTCHVDIDDQGLRIQRLPLFDAICQIGGSFPPAPVQEPKFQFSVPNSYWMSGYPLGVGCVTRLARLLDDWETTVDLSVCLISKEAENHLRRDRGHITLQSLTDSCHLKFGGSAKSARSGDVLETFGTSGIYPDKVATDKFKILCFYRLGEVDPEVRMHPFLSNALHYRVAS